MKILCATDFSPSAADAGRLACGLARRLGDSVELVHVIDAARLGYVEFPVDSPLIDRAFREGGTDGLRRSAAELRASGVTVEQTLLDGWVAEAIAEHAEKIDARLIVTGTHARRGASRLLLGSVAERILLNADRPVLLVREGKTGLTEWLDGKRPLRVVVGVDRSAASVAAVRWARQLRNIGPCEVTFVHVYWPVEECVRLGLKPMPDAAAADKEVLSVLTRELRPLMADLLEADDVSFRVEPAWGRPAEALVGMAQSRTADLLILGTHQKHALQRLWLGSTVHPTLRAATMPVLCVPATPADEAGLNSTPRVARVLAATDLSTIGNRAVAYAYALTRHGGTVTLCHVHDGPMTPAEEASLTTQLQALVPADGNVVTRIAILTGSRPAEALTHEANRLGVDAICLGSHGRTGVQKVALGSVAQTVLQHAKRPVFIVPAQ